MFFLPPAHVNETICYQHLIVEKGAPKPPIPGVANHHNSRIFGAPASLHRPLSEPWITCFPITCHSPFSAAVCAIQTFTLRWTRGADFPSATGRFFLTGGLGIGSIRYAGNSETGLGLLLGLGFDIRIGNNVSLTPFWNGYAVRSSNDDGNVGQIGLGLTIHK